MAPAKARARFLEAAIGILTNEPLSNFTIDRVAECAGTSRRTFFLHYGSKDELLENVLEKIRDAHIETMNEWSNVLDKTSTSEDHVIAIFKRIVDHISEPNWKGSAFIRLSGELADLEGHPVHAVLVAAKIDQELWFQRELERGTYTSPPLLAEQLVVLLTGLLQLQIIHRSPRHGLAVLDMIPTILRAGEVRGDRGLINGEKPLQPTQLPCPDKSDRQN